MAPSPAAGRTAADRADVARVRLFIRDFNAFSSRLNTKLDEGYSLTESRVLFSFTHRSEATVRELRTQLDIDSGYLSRILSRFEREGLIRRSQSMHDRRRQLVTLTDTGKSAVAALDARSNELVLTLLQQMTPSDRTRLADEMDRVHALLTQDSVKRWLSTTPAADT
ncbi:MAG: MarR family winged helix-turn-helix transcriptional regulator [Microbacteriaceae bacterium]